MLKFMFYFWGIFAILWEMNVLYNPVKVRDNYKRIAEAKTGDIPKDLVLLLVLMAGYCLWTIIGLFSSQWICFLVIILLSLIPKKQSVVLRWIDALVTVVILLFIILNAYHLHLNLHELYIKPWL